LLDAAGSTPPIYVVLEDANGDTWNYDLFAAPVDGQFFGAVSDVGLTKVSLYTAPYLNEFGFIQTVNFTIDDVELQSTDVPEPATLALMFGALVAVAPRARELPLTFRGAPVRRAPGLSRLEDVSEPT
jgi:hypothetical protein